MVKKTTANNIKKSTTNKTKKDIKTPKKTEPSSKTESNNGKYIFFKSPKYQEFADKFVDLDPASILKEIEKNNFNLQEKIHIGNLLSVSASKKTQQGEYKIGKKIFYEGNKQKEYEKFYNDCLSKTRAELQKLCELNQMPKSAGKDVLAERVADCLLSGKIPKCQDCYGGRLRFNIFTGEYFCPGYIDGGHFFSDLGDDYIFCNKSFPFDEIKREKFIDSL